MRTTLLDQILRRRKALKIRSSDMTLLAGINRQQYEKIEKSGNPSLITLDKIAEALDAELMLIPKETLGAVRKVLAISTNPSQTLLASKSTVGESLYRAVDSSDSEGLGTSHDDLIADPWALIEGKR